MDNQKRNVIVGKIYGYLNQHHILKTNTKSTSLKKAVNEFVNDQSEYSMYQQLQDLAAGNNQTIIEDEDILYLIPNPGNYQISTVNQALSKVRTKGKNKNNQDTYNLLTKIAIIALINITFKNTNNSLDTEHVTEEDWENAINHFLEPYKLKENLDMDNPDQVQLNQVAIEWSHMTNGESGTDTRYNFLISQILNKVLGPINGSLDTDSGKIIMTNWLKEALCLMLDADDNTLYNWTQNILNDSESINTQAKPIQKTSNTKEAITNQENKGDN